MSKKIVIWIVISVMFNAGFAQHRQIHVRAIDKPLSEVLVELRDSYGFQFSYSENELSKYKVSLSKTFQSPREAVEYLISGFPLSLKMLGNVFIIIPDKKQAQPTVVNKITGRVVDALSYEPLPFSHIIINNYSTISDANGHFAFTSKADSLLHVKISHIGYYGYDSIHRSGKNLRFELHPSVKELGEITVKRNVSNLNLEPVSGLKTGDIKLNNYVANYLPGQGDNAVFNVLRLMPGIQVAGEQASDLLIWGSQEGQSRVVFDGYTIFGLKNYNDNISVVNPFLVKDIKIKKGGFDARYGNRVGGLVHITGINGNQIKPAFSFNINNTTLNAMIEVPLFKKSTLVGAYRQSFYNLYNSDDFNIFAPTRQATNPNSNASRRFDNIDVSVLPDSYRFSDFNLKYSYNFSNGDLASISYYHGGDDFTLLSNASIVRNQPGMGNNSTSFDFELENIEYHRQSGISALYSHQWEQGDISKLSLSRSVFNKISTEKIFSDNDGAGTVTNRDSSQVNNNTVENTFKLTHLVYFQNGHSLELGSGVSLNHANLTSFIRFSNFDSLHQETNYQFNRLFFYINDYFPMGPLWVLNTGARLSYSGEASKKIYFDPRVSLSYKATNEWTFSASWGIYHQFMYKLAAIDRDENYSWFWVTANQFLPVLQARHHVVSANYHKNGFTANIDGYYKTTNNISRRQVLIKQTPRSTNINFNVQTGNMRSAGLDLYLKQEFGQHQAWIAYTLSRTTESLADNISDLPEYSLSPFHQLHEFKIAALFNIRSFYLSGNYVYGSGIQLLSNMFNAPVSYHRLDAAATYRLKRPCFTLETGFSVLNIFNTENLKYQNLININLTRNLGEVKIYTGAVPFTPTLFLKLTL
jgi:hypothetical protein